MFLALLLLSSVSATYLVSFDSMLNPVDIGWPKNWVNNIVELSTNHAGSTSATVTVNCFIGLLLPAGTYVEINLPSFGSTTTYSTTLSADLSAANDIAFVFSSVTLPTTAGSYGPISLVVRQSSTGQVLASSITLGQVAVTSAMPSVLTTLAVTYASSGSTVVSESTSLTFTIPLTAPLQAYDWFNITVDRSFSVGSLTTPVWSSGDSLNALFNTTTMVFDNTASPATIMIYGLQQNVDNGGSLVFTITGFNNPKQAGSTYAWYAKFYRFGTATVLQYFSGSGPSTAVTPGGVTLGSWTPTNGYLTAAQITTGTVTFMTLTFTPQHIVPQGGNIQITYASVTLGKNNRYSTGTDNALANIVTDSVYIDFSPVSFISGCTVSSLTLTCTINSQKDMPAGTQVSIYSLVTFTATSGTVSVSTYTTGNKLIDQKTSLASQSIAANTAAVVLSNDVAFYFVTSKSATNGPANAINGVGASAGALIMDITFPDALSSGFVVTVSLPLSTGSASADSTITVASAVWGNALASAAAVTDWSSVGIAITTLTSASNTLSITSPLPTTATNTHLSLQISGGTSLQTLNFFLPNFATGQYTRYEILVKYSPSTGLIKYLSKPIQFAAGSATLAVAAVCTTSIAPGLPLKISVTPTAWTLSAGYQAYIDFTFVASNTAGNGNNLGSGLSNGAAYPNSGIASPATLTLLINSPADATGTSHLLYSPGPSAGFTNTLFSFYIPVAAFSANTGTLKVIFSQYANRTTDNARFILSSSAELTFTAGTVSTLGAVAFTYANPPTTLYTSAPITSLVTSALTALNTAGTTSLLVAITFDQGWTIPSGATVKLGTNAASTLTLITSSTDPLYKFSTAFATTVVNTPGATIAATLSGATTSWLSSSSSNLWVTIAKVADFVAVGTVDSCELASNNKITLVGQLMTLNSYNLPASEGLGVNVQTVTLKIVLNLPQAIYAGSVITVAVGSNFVAAGATWTVSAGTFTSSITAGTTLAGNTFSTASADLKTNIASTNTLTITVVGVTVPTITSAQKYAGFDTVTVQTSSTYSPASTAYLTFTDSILPAETLSRTSFSIGVTAVGTTTFSLLKTFPSYKGAKYVRLQLQFKPTIAIPAGSKVTITGETFSADTSLRFNTWISTGYTAVTLGSNSITLTIASAVSAGSTVEFRKDRAFDISASATPASWLVSAVWGASTNIITDTATTNKLTFTTAPTVAVTNAAVKVVIDNKGFDTFHKFTFVPGFALSSSTLVAFDVPVDYDAHVGNYVVFSALPTYYWLGVYSSVASSIYCSVDHWLIVCGGFSNISATATVDVNIYLTNPVSSSVKWNIYVMDTTYNLLSNAAYDITLALGNIPAPNIDIYNITHDVPAAQTSTHKVYVKLSDAYAAGSAIYVLFPTAYLVDIYNPGTVSCSAWFNTTTGTTSLVASGSSCSTSGNLVVFNITAASSPSGLWTTLVMNGVFNPTSGLKRTTGLDATNSKVFKTYDFWTQKFFLFSIIGSSATATTISSCSYDNLNAAYTGFYSGTWETLVINAGTSLKVTPGTLSQLFTLGVTNNALNALNLTVSPSDNSGILKFDAKSYVLTNDKPSTSFRVGLASSAASNFYYISWSLTETPIRAGVNVYAAPPKTTVEAFLNTNNLVKVTVGSILTVSASYGSFPIAVSLAGGVTPYSNLKVKFSIKENSTALAFSPSVLDFPSGTSSQFFKILVNGNVTNGQTYTAQYTLDGTDAASFALSSSSSSFTIGSLYPAAAKIKAYFTTTSKVDGTITLDSDSNGIATWALLATSLYNSDNTWVSYNYLTSQASPVIGSANSNQTTVAQQFAAYFSEIAALDQSDWVSFSQKLLVLSEFTFFCGQSFVSNTNGQLVQRFSNLIASTSYTAAVWVDNLSGQNLTVSTAVASTTALDNPTLITVVFSETLANTYLTNILAALAASLKVPTARVIANGSIKSSRSLSSTAAGYLLPSALSSANSLDVAKTLNPATLSTNAKSLGVPVTSTPSVTQATVTQASFGTPSLTGANWNVTSTETAEFTFTAGANGFACCAYQVNDSTVLTSTQLYYGLNEMGEDISTMEDCFEVVAGSLYTYSVNYTGVTVFGNYTYSCTACNNYPILPLCLADSDVSSYTIEYSNQTSSYGYSVAVALFAFVAYLA